jgi:hypothetical protein
MRLAMAAVLGGGMSSCCALGSWAVALDQYLESASSVPGQSWTPAASSVAETASSMGWSLLKVVGVLGQLDRDDDLLAGVTAWAL